MTTNCGFDHVTALSDNPFPLPISTTLQSMDTRALIFNHQQAVVSFNGRTFACDVTELQARAIILLAIREIEEIRKTRQGRDMESSLNCLKSQLVSSVGFSMKRSLKRFLQKREQRNKSSFPYSQL